MSCCVCFEDMEENELITFPCSENHKIGFGCFVGLIQNEIYNCPLCREPFYVDARNQEEEEEEEVEVEEINYLDKILEFIKYIFVEIKNIFKYVLEETYELIETFMCKMGKDGMSFVILVLLHNYTNNNKFSAF